MRRIRQRLDAEVRSLHGGNAIAAIRRLNPIFRGWVAYYRGVGSKEVFSAVDHYLWGRLYRWALRAHPNKSRHWVVDRYFGMFNQSRNDRREFGDRETGFYLRHFAWTKIIRHKMVMGTASPDDPALDWYWASRRRKSHAQLGGRISSLLLRQQGLCSPPAERCCCRPTTVHSLHVSGSSGPRPRRRHFTRPPSCRARSTATIRPRASCTPTADSVNNGSGSATGTMP